VGFGDVGDPRPAPSHQIMNPVDVTLRVDHHGNVAVTGQVASVPEA